MNLKEEIQKYRRTFDGNGLSFHLIEESVAQDIAESYAKEKAWELYKHIVCLYADIQHTPYDEDFEQAGFNLWWNENK